ncbi:MAG: C45 family autoproteolytic acyltransferase/hydrolase [Nocardioidaceae bacterium]
MTVAVHASAEHDPGARGRAFGHSFADRLVSSWDAYGRVFAEHGVSDGLVRRVGDETLAALENWAPLLAAELRGIAHGSGLEPWQAAALNARSEVLAAADALTPGECSTSVFVPSTGAPLTIQTWDWHHATGDTLLIWQYEPLPGRTVKTFTEFGLLAKIGVSSAGLGVHFNLLQHVSDGGQVGIPVHLLARQILDRATSCDEAEALVRSARVSASVALTVVEYDGNRGNACTLEVSPAGVVRLAPDEHGYLQHTNHFLDAELAGGERLGTEDPDTYARMSALGQRTAALSGGDFMTRLQALVQHREDGSALCCHPDQESPWQTHVVVGLDVATGGLQLHDGAPCTASPDRVAVV